MKKIFSCADGRWREEIESSFNQKFSLTRDFGEISRHFHVEKHGVFRIFLKCVGFAFGRAMNDHVRLNVSNDFIRLLEICQIATNQMRFIRSVIRQTYRRNDRVVKSAKLNDVESPVTIHPASRNRLVTCRPNTPDAPVMRTRFLFKSAI